MIGPRVESSVKVGDSLGCTYGFLSRVLLGNAFPHQSGGPLTRVMSILEYSVGTYLLVVQALL